MATDEFPLRDEDRLPWLETVEPDEPEGSNLGRVLLIGLAVLVLAGLVALAVWQYQRGRGASANGELIAAQEGDYKIKPDDPGGLKVGGEGDTAVATSGGNTSAGAIDLKAVPEAQVTGKRAGTAALPAGSAKVATPIPASGGRLTAAPPMGRPPANVPGAASGGSLVQLGAYPSESAANAAWSALAKRFGYVAQLGKEVQQAEVNGRTVYRLRVNAGSAGAAADLCGRLKVAGEGCFVTS